MIACNITCGHGKNFSFEKLIDLGIGIWYLDLLLLYRASTFAEQTINKNDLGIQILFPITLGNFKKMLANYSTGGQTI